MRTSYIFVIIFLFFDFCSNESIKGEEHLIFYGTEASISILLNCAENFMTSNNQKLGTISTVKSVHIPVWRDEGPRSKGVHIWMHFDYNEMLNEGDLKSVKNRLGYNPIITNLLSLHYKVVVNKVNTKKVINRNQLISIFSSSNLTQWKDIREPNDEGNDFLLQNTTVLPILRTTFLPIGDPLINALRIPSGGLVLNSKHNLQRLCVVSQMISSEIGLLAIVPIRDDFTHEGNVIKIIDDNEKSMDEFIINLLLFSEKNIFELPFLKAFISYMLSVNGLSCISKSSGTKVTKNENVVNELRITDND